MFFKRKSNPGKRTPAEQFAVIVERTAGFDAAEAEEERQKLVAAYTGECLEGSRCFDDSVAVVLPGLQRCAEELVICGAFVQPDVEKLNDAIAQYVTAKYVHYRALRLRFWHLEQQTLYGIDLAGFGFSACAAVAIGAHHEAQWLAREYVRHVRAGYDCPYSVDVEFMQFCHWLLSWYLTDDARPQDCPEGMHSTFAQALDDADLVQGAIESVLDTRTDHAFVQFILEENVEPLFYRRLFTSLFPFEVLAFRALVERHHNMKVALTHPAVSHLASMRLPDTHALSDFEPRVENRLAQLEIESGMGTT